jgi:hypothetical protein
VCRWLPGARTNGDEALVREEKWPRLKRFVELMTSPSPFLEFGDAVRGLEAYPLRYLDSNLPLPTRIACLVDPPHIMTIPFIDLPREWTPPAEPLEAGQLELVRVFALCGPEVDRRPKASWPFTRYVGRKHSEEHADCPWFEAAVGPEVSVMLRWLLGALEAESEDHLVIDLYEKYVTLLRLTADGVRAGLATDLRVHHDPQEGAGSPYRTSSRDTTLKRWSVSVQRSSDGAPPGLTRFLRD